MADRTVYINGTFMPDTCRGVMAQLRKMDRESSEDVTIVINSYGGDLSACLAIYDQIKRMRCNVVTMVLGKAMSAGAFIFIAGTPGKRIMGANATLMHHEPLGMAELSEAGMECITRQRDYVFKILAETSNRSVEEVAQMLTRNLYMTADEAKAYGWCDLIVGQNAGE